MVAHGTPCLGPITHAGCGALCPSYHRGCYGCFGPSEIPNAPGLTAQFQHTGMADVDLVRLLQTFNAATEPFRERPPTRSVAVMTPSTQGRTW